MNIVLFEDPPASQLAPIALTRPAYTIRCGSLCLAELAAELGGVLHGAVRPYLTEIQSDFISTGKYEPSQSTLLLNARLVPDARMLSVLRPLLADHSPFQLGTKESTMAALVSGSAIQANDIDPCVVLDLISGITHQHPSPGDALRLIEFPHELIAENERIIKTNLEHRLAAGQYKEIRDGVFAAGEVNLPEQVALNAADGPIVLDEGVTIGPFSVVTGPIHIGADSMISPHTHLMGHITIGHTCKVGGEVSKSIIESYSNKVHYGYLGNSYVGSWVNLGAGTTNSNLKNTYGSVRVQYGEQKIDTGLQFLGCIIGDFSKTAINTGIYTGKTIGVCSNVYGMVTTNVPSFANYARDFGEVTEHPPEVMEVAQRRVFARRGIHQRPCDVQLLRDVYQSESNKRDLANHPPSF